MKPRANASATKLETIVRQTGHGNDLSQRRIENTPRRRQCNQENESPCCGAGRVGDICRYDSSHSAWRGDASAAESEGVVDGGGRAEWVVAVSIGGLEVARHSSKGESSWAPCRAGSGRPGCTIRSLRGPPSSPLFAPHPPTPPLSPPHSPTPPLRAHTGPKASNDRLGIKINEKNTNIA